MFYFILCTSAAGGWHEEAWGNNMSNTLPVRSTTSTVYVTLCAVKVTDVLDDGTNETTTTYYSEISPCNGGSWTGQVGHSVTTNAGIVKTHTEEQVSFSAICGPKELRALDVYFAIWERSIAIGGPTYVGSLGWTVDPTNSPIDNKLYRWEHDNLVAAKEWCSENIPYFINPNTEADYGGDYDAMFNNGGSYSRDFRQPWTSTCWTVTGILATCSLPESYLTSTPWRAISSYSNEWQGMRRILTNLVWMGQWAWWNNVEKVANASEYDEECTEGEDCSADINWCANPWDTNLLSLADLGAYSNSSSACGWYSGESYIYLAQYREWWGYDCGNGDLAFVNGCIFKRWGSTITYQKDDSYMMSPYLRIIGGKPAVDFYLKRGWWEYYCSSWSEETNFYGLTNHVWIYYGSYSTSRQFAETSGCFSADGEYGSTNLSMIVSGNINNNFRLLPNSPLCCNDQGPESWDNSNSGSLNELIYPCLVSLGIDSESCLNPGNDRTQRYGETLSYYGARDSHEAISLQKWNVSGGFTYQ